MNTQQKTEVVYSQTYSDRTAIPGMSFTDVANRTTVQPGNKDPLEYVDCICRMLRSSVIKVSGEIDTRPWVSVSETGSDNQKVCPLGEGQWDSCSVEHTMCHRANPLHGLPHNLTLYMLTHHLLSSWYYGWDKISLTEANKHIKMKIRWYASTSNYKQFSAGLCHA